MGDRRIQRIDHPHRQDQVQVFGGVVGLVRRRHAGDQRPGGGIAAQLDPACAQRVGSQRQEARRDVGMHQQGLQRIAGRRTRHLAVQQQAQRQLQVGAVVHVQVAHALVVLDHRYPRMLGDEADQALATARDRQVDDVVELQQLQHGLSTQILHQGQRGIGYASLAQGALERGGDRGIGMDRLRAAAQDHAVAGLDAQRRGVGGDVRARLVDHRDHPQRHAYLLHADAIGPRVVAGHLADRVRQRGNLAQGVGHAGQALPVQGQAIEHRRAHALVARSLQVAFVGGQDGAGIGVERIGHRCQQSAPCIAGKTRQHLRGVAALPGKGLDVGHAYSSREYADRSWLSCAGAVTAAAPGRRGGSRCRHRCSRGWPGSRGCGGGRCGARPPPSTG